MPAGACTARAGCWSWTGCGPIGGWAGGRPGAWMTGSRAGRRSMACCPPRRPRSSSCSTSGARPAGRTASSPTVVPTCAGCRYRHRACGGCGPRMGCGCAARSGRAARRASHSRTGWSTGPGRSGFMTRPASAAGMAVVAIMDLVSRKWICEVVSAGETSAPGPARLHRCAPARGPVAAGRGPPGRAGGPGPRRPGAAGAAGGQRQRAADDLRPGRGSSWWCARSPSTSGGRTPRTDQAWIETLFGHVKAEFAHLLKITDPAVLRAELANVRNFYNTVSIARGHRLCDSR